MDVGLGRTDFLRDSDSVLFSEPFRRLHDKTQVFPLPENDHVSTRLTHSLEAASVGRSLGRMVGEKIRAYLGDLTPADVGDCVAAACLAHDIGHPPFGHAGEEAVQSWFRKKLASDWLSSLPKSQQNEFVHFNGNAQGFRILTDIARTDRIGGLRLTAATLGAYIKYPRFAAEDGKRKFSIFRGDEDAARWVAEQTGLQSNDDGWARHPLAYLVEAADDMAYSTRDLEDGLRLGLVTFGQYLHAVTPIVGEDDLTESVSASMGRAEMLDVAARLRSRAIGRLIEAAGSACAECWPFLQSSPHPDLLGTTPYGAAMAALADLAKQCCYQAEQVMRLEVSGFNVVHRILDLLELAAFRTDREQSSSGRGWRMRKLLRWPDELESTYERAHRMLDVVASMTDRFAIDFGKRLYGITIPRQL